MLRLPLLALFTAGLLAPAAAQAASAKPDPTTGPAANIAPTSVVLTGSVDPNRAATTYFFQIGPNKLYGTTTAPASAGGGDSRVNVAVGVGDLAPDTRYHYRLVARNRNGLVPGADRTFRTARQPLGVTLAATPNPVPYGKGTTLAGQVTGSGNGGREVVLQANAFPYTAGFAAVGNPQVAAADGTFAFPLLTVPSSAQYRVLIPDKPEVVSPIVSVGVRARVGTQVSDRRVARGQRVRFSGTVRPARDGARIAIQKLRGKRWVTVAGTVARHGRATHSRYSKRVRIMRGGRYRVYVQMLGSTHVSSAGRTVRIVRG